MGAKRRQFTPEFQIEAVRLVNSSDKPLALTMWRGLSGPVIDPADTR
ncbi:hypothetical protein BH23GEM3_BH23GEM3_09660 [soil metagenome]